METANAESRGPIQFYEKQRKNVHIYGGGFE